MGATVVLCMGLFVISLDFTVLNVAVPDLQRSLSPSMAQVEWMMAGFALTLGGLVLAVGALSDRWGRRRFFLAGSVILALTSGAGALSDTPAEVIAARCGAGVGAAMLMPSTLSIITGLFTVRKHRERAVAAWASVAGIGAVLGPVVGGFLIERSSWRAGFWINLPLCAVIFVLALLLVPESRDPDARSIDVLGTVLSSAGMLALLWAIITAPLHGWTGARFLTGSAVAAVLLIAFVIRQFRAQSPLVPPELLRTAQISVGMATLLLLSFAIFGALFVVSLYLQNILGYSAEQAGLRTAPLAAAMALGAFAGTPFISRGASRVAILAGLVLTAAAFVALAGIDAGSGYGRIVFYEVLAGAGCGLIIPAATDLVQSFVPPAQAGTGSAINDASRELGSALGVAVQGSLLATHYTAHSPGPSVGTVRLAREQFTQGMTAAACAGLIALLAGLLVCWRWLPGRGADRVTSPRPADRSPGQHAPVF